MLLEKLIKYSSFLLHSVATTWHKHECYLFVIFYFFHLKIAKKISINWNERPTTVLMWNSKLVTILLFFFLNQTDDPVPTVPGEMGKCGGGAPAAPQPAGRQGEGEGALPQDAAVIEARLDVTAWLPGGHLQSIWWERSVRIKTRARWGVRSGDLTVQSVVQERDLLLRGQVLLLQPSPQLWYQSLLLLCHNHCCQCWSGWQKAQIELKMT